MSRDQVEKLDTLPPLSNQALIALDFQEKNLVSKNTANTCIKNCNILWDKFYNRNKDKFFRDRYWIKKEFPIQILQKRNINFFDIGCGVGNTSFPLHEHVEHLEWNFFMIDFSEKAIHMVKNNEKFKKSIMTAKCLDIVQLNQNDNLPLEHFNFATLIYVLSSIPPEKMEKAIINIHKTMKKGGLLYFRDYALNDNSMIRFKRHTKISDNFYTRQDGTLSYFFEKEEIILIFVKCGFSIVNDCYIKSNTVNRKENTSFYKYCVQILLEKK